MPFRLPCHHPGAEGEGCSVMTARSLWCHRILWGVFLASVSRRLRNGGKSVTVRSKTSVVPFLTAAENMVRLGEPFFNRFWNCPVISTFFCNVRKSVSIIMHKNVPLSPKLFIFRILHDMRFLRISLDYCYNNHFGKVLEILKKKKSARCWWMPGEIFGYIASLSSNNFVAGSGKVFARKISLYEIDSSPPAPHSLMFGMFNITPTVILPDC